MVAIAREKREGILYVIALGLPHNELAVARWLGEVAMGTYGSPALCQRPSFLFLFAFEWSMGLMGAILGVRAVVRSPRVTKAQPSVGWRQRYKEDGTLAWGGLAAHAEISMHCNSS